MQALRQPTTPSTREDTVDTHLEVTLVEPGTYQVKAMQGHVVTQQRLAVDQGHLEQSGVDGVDLIREVCDILSEHEALTAVPARSTVEQLVAHYPYPSSELQSRLAPESPGLRPRRARPHRSRAGRGPSHPHLTAGLSASTVGTMGRHD